MAIPSGLSASVGIGEEVTWGTAVTPTKWLPFVSESLTKEIERLESDGIIVDRRVRDSSQWEAGTSKISGDLSLELTNRSVGMLLKHAFGGVATAGPTASYYTHTLTPDTLTGKGLTVQVGRPDVTGTVRPFTYAGCKVTGWELSVAAGQIPTISFSFLGKSESTATALTTPSFAAGIKPMSFAGASLVIPDATPTSVCVRSVTLSGENALADDRMCVGQSTIDEPLENDLRTYSGEMEVEFNTLDFYNRYVDSDELALTLTIVQGTAQLVVTTNVRFDGVTPNVDGKGLVVVSVPFVCVGSTDAAAITAAYKTLDSTP